MTIKEPLTMRALNRFARRIAAYVEEKPGSKEQLRAFMLTQEAWHLAQRLLDARDKP